MDGQEIIKALMMEEISLKAKVVMYKDIEERSKDEYYKDRENRMDLETKVEQLRDSIKYLIKVFNLEK